MLSLLKGLVKTAQRPKFDVVESTSKYDVRKYPSAKWVSTSQKSISHKEARTIAFRRLFNYIQGENEGKKTVDMTVPVTTRVDPGEGPNCESTFQMSFYVPEEFQENPPKPTNPEVFLEERPEMTVYVSTFGGFGDDETWVQQARQLCDAIGDETKFITNFYYTVGYDSPYRLMGRTNEIWFVKKD